MGPRDAFASAVRQRNLRGVMQLMFEPSSTTPRHGYRTETELWDYKANCPSVGAAHEVAWSELAVDVLAFHNVEGGLLVFGINDDYQFVGATNRLDSKLFNDQLRRFLPDTIWVEFHREFIQDDQRYLGLALIPPRGPLPASFRGRAPVVQNKQRFAKGDSARRVGDSSLLVREPEYEEWVRSLRIPTISGGYEVDEPFYRLLKPDYHSFIERPVVGSAIESAMRDPRSAVTSLIGLGGMGKTALATWAVARAHAAGDFDLIVSATAKDRELTGVGILAVEGAISSFSELLDAVADVLGFPELKAAEGIDEKERGVRSLLEDVKALLFVDNLETVDDVRVISFLDSLPIGTRAITTSRRTRVRVSVHPVDVGAMTSEEVLRYTTSLLDTEPFKHLGALRSAEIERIGQAWEGVPLAIRWALSRSASVAEVLSTAEQVMSLGKHGDELLEFSFRRVFDGLNRAEKSILQVLSTLQKPIPLEAVVVGCEQTQDAAIDAVDDLSNDALIQRVFDPDRNDYCFTVMPLTRAFVQRDIRKTPEVAHRIQRSLSSWFDATDVRDANERMVVRELRRGAQADDSAIVDLALSAEKRGDHERAEELFIQACTRNPRSWRAARYAAEFYRHVRKNSVEALRQYRAAAANAPSRGSERALIFREYGLLVRESGEPDSDRLAEEALVTALNETPNDEIALAALAGLYDKRGAYRKVIEVLEGHKVVGRGKFARIAGPLLLKAYDRTTELAKAAQLRGQLDESNR